jgi:hypothetical protein|nr:MAG TPA: tail assembly chaperone protein [Caudoviricetes sp.]
MKKTVVMAAEGKTWELCFTIHSLAAFERKIGKSIISIVAGGVVHMVEQMNIDATVAGLRCALSISEDEAYDLIDEICSGGGNLDYINRCIINAILATGLFGQDKEDTETEDEDAGKQ